MQSQDQTGIWFCGFRAEWLYANDAHLRGIEAPETHTNRSSAGLLLFRQRGNLEIFSCTRGVLWAKKDEGAVASEGGIHEARAARRQRRIFEETGFSRREFRALIS